jgi:uncharacterized protein YktA (UPF0223 family)
MLTAVGTFQNGFVKLDKDYSTNTPVKVIITFLEEVESNSEKEISLSDFSFSKSKKNLKNFKGSFGDSVVSERREAI